MFHTIRINKFLKFIFCFAFLSHSILYSADIQFTAATPTPLTSPNVYYVPNGSIVNMTITPFTINSGATLEVRAGGTLNLGNGSITVNNGATIKVMAGATLNTQTRYMACIGDLKVCGALNVTTFSGRINVTNSGGFFGTLQLFSPGIITIAGSDGLIGTDGSIFYNYGGTLNILGGGYFRNPSGFWGEFYQFNGTTNINTTSAEGLVNGGTFGGTTYGRINIYGGMLNLISGPLNNGYVAAGTINLSGGEVKIFGGGTLQNGRAAITGTVNVSDTGKLSVIGGNIINNNAPSAINVNRGGNVNNYYGTINTTLGSFIVNSGGRFYNVRGNYPAHITFNTGSACEDSDEVYLTDDIYLDSTWTITNKAVINGQGHVLTFSSSNGIIRIAKRASLLLRDIVIQNVSSNQIRCMDTFSTLSLDKCTWLLDADYSFTKGRMYIAGDWNIVGNNHSFSYQSRKESSLAEDANLNIVDTTFIYDINISNTLFNPLSNTSNICLQNSTLQASQNWKPASGTLLFNGNVTLKGVATLDLQNISNIQNHGSISRIGTVLM